MKLFRPIQLVAPEKLHLFIGVSSVVVGGIPEVISGCVQAPYHLSQLTKFTRVDLRQIPLSAFGPHESAHPMRVFQLQEGVGQLLPIRELSQVQPGARLPFTHARVPASSPTGGPPR